MHGSRTTRAATESKGPTICRSGSTIGSGELAASVRRCGDAFSDTYGLVCTVVVADDLPPVDRSVGTALVGAISEALTNVGKHAQARTVTVYVEPDDDRSAITAWVRDDGDGFDASTVVSGVGLARSIVGRVESVGGSVKIVSEPTRGTELELHVPGAPDA